MTISVHTARPDPVERIDRSKWAVARDALARSFQTYPLLVDVAPDLRVRVSGAQALYGAVLNDCFRHGEVDWIDGGAAIACWLPPSRCVPSTWRHLRSGMLRTWPALGTRGFRRLLAYDHIAQRLHHLHAQQPHWFLATIGVQAERRGQGLAGRLLRPQLARFAAAGQDAYLETHDPVNVPLYERFGFQVCERVEHPGLAATTWSMRYRCGAAHGP